MQYSESEPLLSNDSDKALNKSIRVGFVRKVLGIVTVQLVLTYSILMYFINSPKIYSYLTTTYWPLLISFILYLFIACAIICCKSVARRTPTNYILLFVLTGAISVILTYTCSLYTADSVSRAFAITAVISFALTMYALTSKVKMSLIVAGILVVILAMILSLILLVFDLLPWSWYTVYCFLAVVLFGLFLVYDVKRISSKKYGLSVDDYIFGALMIYLDIINLFLQILKLIGDRR